MNLTLFLCLTAVAACHGVREEHKHGYRCFHPGVGFHDCSHRPPMPGWGGLPGSPFNNDNNGNNVANQLNMESVLQLLHKTFCAGFRLPSQPGVSNTNINNVAPVPVNSPLIPLIPTPTNPSTMIASKQNNQGPLVMPPAPATEISKPTDVPPQQQDEGALHRAVAAAARNVVLQNTGGADDEARCHALSEAEEKLLEKRQQPTVAQLPQGGTNNNQLPPQLPSLAAGGQGNNNNVPQPWNGQHGMGGSPNGVGNQRRSRL